MTVNFRFLAALTSKSPLANIFVYIRPYKSFCDELMCSTYSRVREAMKTVKYRAAKRRRNVRTWWAWDTLQMIVPAEHAKGRVFYRREDVSRVCRSLSFFCASARSAKSITVGAWIALISILDKDLQLDFAVLEHGGYRK